MFWPEGHPRPAEAFGIGDRQNAWYLTSAGAVAAGLELPPVRFA